MLRSRSSRVPIFLAACLVLAGSARAEEASDDAEAKRHFMTGVAYLQDQEGERYEEAYAEFKTAYNLSHAPKVLGNLALCAMKLERDGEAIDSYTRYLAEVPNIDPGERDQIEFDLATLKQSVVRFSATTHDAGGALFDTRYPSRGTPIVNVYDVGPGKHELRVRPGHHLVVLKVAGQERARWEFTAAGGGDVSHDFSPQERSKTSHIGPIVTMGVGGATLVAASILGIATMKKVNDLEHSCPNNGCPADSFGDVDRTRTFVRVTDTLFIAGGVITAAGLGWLLLSSSRPAETAPTASAACTGQGCFATFRTGF